MISWGSDTLNNYEIRSAWLRAGGELIDTEKAAAEEQNMKDHAQIVCRLVLKDNLKAPDSADFQSYTKDYVESKGNGKFLVQTRVDAINSFGAKLRGTFNCTVQCPKYNEYGCVVTSLKEIP